MQFEVHLKDYIGRSDDIQLAELELSGLGTLEKTNGTQRIYTTDLKLEQLISDSLDLSFAKEVLIPGIDKAIMPKVKVAHPNAVSLKENTLRIVPLSLFYEFAEAAVKKSSNITQLEKNLETVLEYIDSGYKKHKNNPIIVAIEKNGKHNDYLSHGIHKFKAKFFPRMARSLTNYCTNFDRTKKVLDPFNGSGTTTMECALLGNPSTGFDLDPVSVTLADQKIKCLGLNGISLQKEIDNFKKINIKASQQRRLNSQKHLDLPPEIERKLTAEQKSEIVHDIGLVLDFIESLKPQNKLFFKIILSDAINVKLRMRFMGTGVGRFALSVAKGRISRLFQNKSERMVLHIFAYNYLKLKLNLRPLTHAKIEESDARKLSYKGYDAIVTSPPYLPAASGRESYALSKSMSITLLGLGTVSNPKKIDSLIVGSMNPSVHKKSIKLPKDVYTLVDWLEKDPLRNIKAQPTMAYFEDMQQILDKMHSELPEGSKVAMVVSKASQFYRYKTRETLFVVDVRKIFEEMFSNSGFKRDRILDVELAKTNPVARPRALDKYYETILIFER